MTTWADTETGEIFEGPCPECGSTQQNCEDQLRAMELELRKMRAEVTRIKRQAERDIVAKRDGAAWKDILAYWLAAFPDKRPTAKGVKSARATKVFLRLESGASLQDVKDAIDGAKLYPYVVFGKRQKSGSKSDVADDLEDICAVKRDKEFDYLRDAGARVRAEREQAAW